MSWTITPTVSDLAVTSALARRFGWKESRSAAESTRCRVGSLTGWLDPDMTRDAVATETPASSATCRSEVGLLALMDSGSDWLAGTTRGYRASPELKAFTPANCL